MIIGTRLGPYEIVAAIGAGGMGEVYRARDTKLNRDVAIKVLPPLLAGDSERLARFRREAQVLASLNHPNIAHLYGFEDAPSTGSGQTAITHALVMELVEGPTLADRIAAGPMAVADVLPIARQIAEALETAHDQGIVHRDLKPANVKVRDDGTVKVLDFGLAKAMDPVSGSSADAMNSPTLTAGTQMGMILGTAAYMSPEQAKGRIVDRRADIWAFGVVVYEMLTGERLFKGEDISDTLASVLKDKPTLDVLPRSTPPRLTRLLERCLDRDPKTRLRDIGEARVEIMKIEAGAPDSSVAFAPSGAIHDKQSRVSRTLPWALFAAAVLALGVSLALWAPWQARPVAGPRKLLAHIGADVSLGVTGAPAILSPDGSTLVFVGVQGAQSRLFIRKLDQLQAAPLAGSDGASIPFFSPSGEWIGFFADGKLKKVSVTGGAAVTLCDAPAGRGGTWLDDDTIIFTPSASPNVKLLHVPAAGGTPTGFGTVSPGAVTQRWPQILPGGQTVLYSENSTTTGWDAGNVVVAPLSGGMPKVVVRGGYFGRYVPTAAASGHLLYLQQGTVFAVNFDLKRLEIIGQAVPAIEGVSVNTTTGGAQLALSTDGTLVYVPGGAASNKAAIEWMTRDGKMSALRAAKAEWSNPRFSPDGQRLALQISDGKQDDIWVYEWTRDTMTQVTFDPAQDRSPVWTADGRHITFASDRAKTGVANLYWVNADGTGDVTRLTNSEEDQRPGSWHPTGKFLTFYAIRPATSWDLFALPMQGDAAKGWTAGAPTVFLATPKLEFAPVFSPDGRWIAYFSNEAGAVDVYVRPFPGPGGKWRVSTEGGVFPEWSPTAHELLFTSMDGKVMFAPYAVVGDSFRADKPQVWSPTGLRLLSGEPFAIHPDGKRLALAVAQGEAAGLQDKVVFVFNFVDYLNKIAPARK